MDSAQPFILTLKLEPRLSAVLDTLRQAHFPPERNFLAAHVTLFHALPSECEAALRRDLSDVAAATLVFGVALPRLGHWGNGVFLWLESPALLALRERLKSRWAAELTRQDCQGYRPHVTIQNKVATAEALALFEHLNATWQPLNGDALGLNLWRYAGGPWVFVETFDFVCKS